MRVLGQSPTDNALIAYNTGSFERALGMLPESTEEPSQLKLRADCLHKLGRLSEARDTYDRAKIQGYAAPDLYLNRGICKSSLGLYDEAKQDLVVFIEKQPEDAKGYYWMAEVEYLTMNHKACLRYVDESIWLDSSNASAFYLRGANYMEMGNRNFALEDFETAYQVDPQLHRAKLNVALILLELEQLENAIEVLSELKNENTGFPAEVLSYRGEAYYRLHDIDGACIDWHEASMIGDINSGENYKKICLDKVGKPKFRKHNYYEF